MVDLLIYPTLLSLTSSCVKPLPFYYKSIQSTGIYLLDTGVNVFFYIGKHCPSESIYSLFENIKSGPMLFNPPENHISSYVSELIVYLISYRSIKPRFILANDTENSVYSYVFNSYMYDDMMYQIKDIEQYRKDLSNVR